MDKDKVATNGVIRRVYNTKDNLHRSVAELHVMYGTTLCFPTKFFHSTDSNNLDQVTYVIRPTETVKQLMRCSTLDFATALSQPSQRRQTWRQNLHSRNQHKTEGDITGSPKTSSHQRLLYNRCYTYWWSFHTSFAIHTDSTTHNKENPVRITHPLAWSLCSMNIHIQWGEYSGTCVSGHLS